MDAAVSLHHHGHGALAAASALPPHHRHHALLHLKHPAPSVPTRLAATAAPSRPPRRSSSTSSAAPARASTATATAAASSARAATGYAAALADASLRAGTLPGAARHARALLRRLHAPPNGQRLQEADPRVAALVRMLVGKGKGGLVADVLAEFAAICDHLLAPPPTSASASSSSSSKRAHSAAAAAAY